jgi:amidase
MDDLSFTPAAELSGLLRAGQVSATDLVELSLRRIEALDPSLGAFVDVDAEGALAAAGAVQAEDRRAFAGVPIAVKANTAVAGLISDHGSKLFDGHRYTQDAFLVRRLREAGFIVIGTTRMPELGLMPTTEPRHGGPSRNPWNPAHTPGGSSGGSAAAVAAGLVPLAHGNDGGGSIRIPAACCGLVGLKPSRGRVSRGIEQGEDFLVSDGVLTRTVTDTAYALDVLAGYEVGDATWAARPTEPFSIGMRRDPGRLCIALMTSNLLGAPVDPECERAAREAAELLSGLGHDVEEATPMDVGPEALGLFTLVFAADKARAVLEAAARRGHPAADDDLEPLTRGFVELAEQKTAGEYLLALKQLQRLARDVVAFFADYDLLLTPALAQRPPAVGELHGCSASPLEDFGRAGQFAPYTALFNVSGQPAISIPFGFGPDGLPTGIQLAAHPLAEDTLLQVARQIETARPWAQQTPELAALSA